jgi:hypothetical protein
MDRLSLTLLLLLFIFSGSGLTVATLLIYLFTGIATLDHVTLFSTSTLLTYYFYGLFGLMYLFGCVITIVVCGLMYWLEMSLDTIRQQANDMHNQANEIHIVNNNVNNTISDQTFDIDPRIKRFQKYGNDIVTLFRQKTRLTDEKITLIRNYYILMSSRFDIFTTWVIKYITRFRELTQDITGLKLAYYLIDKFFLYKETIESYRTLHKVSRDLQSKFPYIHNQRAVSPTTIIDNTTDNTNNNINTPNIFNQTQSGDPFGMFGDMIDIKNIQRQMENITPEEKRIMDEMAMQMLGNMMNLGGLDTFPNNQKQPSNVNPSKKSGRK